MAEEEAKEVQEEEKEGAGKKSNMLMIIIIAVLVLIIVIGAVVAVVLMGDDEEQAVSNNTPVTRQAAEPQKRRANTALAGSRRLSDIGILYPLDSFTVNLKSDSGRRYLKATLSLELSDEALSVELDAKAPVVRDRIIRILTSKTLEEISSKKGKQKVSDQIQDTLNSMISDGKIQGIYFTEFVIQ